MEKIFDLSSPLYERVNLFYILITDMGEIFTDDYLNALYKMVEDYNKTTKPSCGIRIAICIPYNFLVNKNIINNNDEYMTIDNACMKYVEEELACIIDIKIPEEKRLEFQNKGELLVTYITKTITNLTNKIFYTM